MHSSRMRTAPTRCRTGEGVSVQGGICPGDLCPGGVSVWGSLSGGVSDQGDL